MINNWTNKQTQTGILKLVDTYNKLQHVSANYVASTRDIQYTNQIHFKYLKESVKGKAGPLQDWSDPEGSRKLWFPDFMTTAQGSGKVVSLTNRSPLSPRNTPGTYFC
jgi:hypothetical protein